MGDIVTRWITEKLGLEVPHANDPPSFRIEVANGILIAEILRKYGILSDDEFVSLRHSNTKKSRHLNMKYIHKWLTAAGMDIQQIFLVDVAEEKTGSAVKFLYELFLWLENGTRKPKVGDKAKKYLTTLKMSPDGRDGTVFLEESPFANYRPSHAKDARKSTMLSRLSWERSYMQSPPETKTKKIIIRKPNWYTSLDKIIAPKQILNAGPFSELSEAAQAEALYFTKESLDILERQRVLFNRVETHLQEATHQHHFRDFKFNIPTADAKAHCQLKAKLQEQKYSIEEIRKFDRRLKAKSTKKNGEFQRPSQAQYDRVYCDGKGSPEQLEKSLQALKSRRQKVQKINEKLGKCRKAAAQKMLELVPSISQKDLEETVVKTVSRLPFSERMFADFIYNSHVEKISFKQHACFDAREKQTANDFDLEKELQISKQQDDLKRSVLEHRTQQPSKRVEDEEDKELEEVFVFEKMGMIDEMLNNLVDIVVMVSDYRSAMGNAAFGSDLFKDSIDTGAGIQAGVTLQGDKFVMQPKQNTKSEVFVILPAPLPSVFTMEDSYFLVHHIAILLDRFLQIANGSLIPMKAFTFIISDLILMSTRAGEAEARESLPPAWLRLSPGEIKKVVYLLMGKRGFINWRNFLIACMDIPFPTQTEIISILRQFQHLDPASLFSVDKDKFDMVSLWFEPKPPCVLSDAFYALHLRECIFFMFADLNGYFYYIDFLLYFCKDVSPALGLVKALAVLTGQVYATKAFETIYNRATAVIMSDGDLELMFEKPKFPLEDLRVGSLVPPNTPLPKRKTSKGLASAGEGEEKTGKNKYASKIDYLGGKKPKKRKSKLRKSFLQGEMKDPVKRGDVKFASGRTETAVVLPEDRKSNYYIPNGGEKPLGIKIPFQKAGNNFTARQSVSEKLFEAPNMQSTTEDDIPAEAFLQAMWFGHITSYPVEDPSFVSTEYMKMKKFIEMAYAELHQNRLANFEDGVYSAQVQQLLEHPFIREIMKRFITYRVVDLKDLLKEVIPSASSDLELDNMESPPSTASRDPTGKEQRLSDDDSQAELEGTTSSIIINVTSDPNQLTIPTSLLDGNRPEVLQVEHSGSIPPTNSVSAPNAVSASAEAHHAPRAPRKAKSNNPASITSSVKSKL